MTGDGGADASVDEASVDAAVELVAVAVVVKTRGLRGEVVAEMLTDFPERFEGLASLIAVSPDGTRRVLALEDHWLQGKRIVFKFAGFDSPEAAAALVRHELAVRESETVELEPDEFFDWQLKGCHAETTDGIPFGVVEEILHTGSAPVLVIRDEGRREHLVPLVESICVEIDIEAKRIRVDAPEGLLEL